MSALFASGRVIDFILALTVLEALALVAYHRRTGRGIPAGDVVSTLASGMCLMLALRCALVGAGWMWVAACVAASGLAHLVDLRRRWSIDGTRKARFARS